MTKDLPQRTEMEWLVVQRVGQELFQKGLLRYWEGRCAVTGLSDVDGHVNPAEFDRCVAWGERVPAAPEPPAAPVRPPPQAAGAAPEF